MIIILGAIVIMMFIASYMLFRTMIQYSQQQNTAYFLFWFFGLLAINLLITIVIVGYDYYKRYINPYQGKQGVVGYKGVEGDIGMTQLLCD